MRGVCMKSDERWGERKEANMPQQKLLRNIMIVFWNNRENQDEP